MGDWTLACIGELEASEIRGPDCGECMRFRAASTHHPPRGLGFGSVGRGAWELLGL